MVDFPLPCLINGGYNLVDFFSKRFADFLRILQDNDRFGLVW